MEIWRRSFFFNLSYYFLCGNKQRRCEWERAMTVSSGLATAREPATTNLAFGRYSSRGTGKLGSGEKGAFRWAQAVGVRKLWAGQREARCSTWLVRVQTQLPLLGPQLEVQRKNRKLLSCYSSPSYLKLVVTVIVYSRISWQKWQTDFLQVWLQAGWLPGLVTGDNWLVSWPGCCRLWGRVLFLNTVWPSYICIANF